MSGANGTRRSRLPIRMIKPLHIKASLVPTVRSIVIEMEDHLDHPNQDQQQEEQPTATNVDSSEGTQAEILQSSLNLNSESLVFSLHSIENGTTSRVDIKGKSKTRISKIN